MIQLILGSSSSSRKHVLTQLNLNFSCVSPDIDETLNPGELVHNYVRRLSLEKAWAVLAQIKSPSLIIACDQVAHDHQNTIYGKPKNKAEAVKFLKEFSGTTIEYLNSMTVLNSITQQSYSGYSKTELQYKELSPALIEHYTSQPSILSCAGGFQIEGMGPLLLKTFKTEDPTSILGLPILLLDELVQKHLLNLFDFCL